MLFGRVPVLQYLTCRTAASKKASLNSSRMVTFAFRLILLEKSKKKTPLFSPANRIIRVRSQNWKPFTALLTEAVEYTYCISAKL